MADNSVMYPNGKPDSDDSTEHTCATCGKPIPSPSADSDQGKKIWDGFKKQK